MRVRLWPSDSESAAIYVCRYLLEESARVSIYDPKVARAQIVSDLTEHDPSPRVLERGTPGVPDPPG